MVNSNSFPKIYRPSAALRILLFTVGAAFCSLSYVLITVPRAGLFIYLLGMLIAGLGIIFVVLPMASKVTLFHDRIVQSSIFAKKELWRREIQGYRSRIVNRATFVDLIPSNDHRKKITVTEADAKDALFSAWLKGLRNLDEEDQQAVDQEIAHDESLGATPEQRKARVESIRRSATFLTYGYLAAVIFFGVYPHPLWLAVSTPLVGPWIAITMVLVSSKNFTILETGKAVALRKGNLFQLLILPMFFYYAMFSSTANGLPNFPLDWHPLILPSAVGGLTILGIVWLLSRGTNVRPLMLAAATVPLFIYVAGSMVLLNGVLDHAAPQNHSLVVINKHQTTGKGAANFLQVRSDDASYDGDSTIRVSYNIYRAVAVNDRVCAHIHPGALGMRWEDVDLCQFSLKTPAPARPQPESVMSSQSRLHPQRVEAQIRAVAEDITRQGPKMVNADTRFDSVTADPGLRLTFNYTLIKLSSNQVLPYAFRNKFAPRVRASNCNLLQLKGFLEYGVTMVYEYRGKDGGSIGSVEINRAICSQI